jgi:Flp pilus assembly protein TadG
MIAQRSARLHERGSTLAEFAVVLTASMVLIVGIIDFGRALYTYQFVSNAARIATRYASVRGATCSASGCPATASSIQTYVRSLAPELNQAQISVVPTWNTTPSCAGPPSNGPGCTVSVQVTYPFTFAAVHLLPSFTMSMSSTSKMIISL